MKDIKIKQNMNKAKEMSPVWEDLLQSICQCSKSDDKCNEMLLT